jgi:hypothetical protein
MLKKKTGVLVSLAHRSRSCAGTTIGSQNSVETYCRMMLSESRRTVREVSEGVGRTFEGRITTHDGRWVGGWVGVQAHTYTCCGVLSASSTCVFS